MCCLWPFAMEPHLQGYPCKTHQNVDSALVFLGRPRSKLITKPSFAGQGPGVVFLKKLNARLWKVQALQTYNRNSKG